MLAPMGIGFLYGKRELLEGMEPFLAGGEMIAEVDLERATWAELPHKFEAGTPDVAGAVGLAAAIDFLNDLGMEAVFQHEQELVRYALNALREVDGVTILHGSITVNGVSLTVNALPAAGRCQVALIPHTRAVTTLGGVAAGDPVNLEGDLIGKFVGRLVASAPDRLPTP